MQTAKTYQSSWYRRNTWTVFVLVGAMVALIGAGDLSSSYGDHTSQENALNELFLGLLPIAIAVGGMRRGQRWAWYAMSVWTVWIAAQVQLALSFDRTGEAITAIVILALSLAALALSFRNPLEGQR
jgi:hypothetical protein